MAANINDKITSARSGGSNANVTTVSGARAIGGTSLSCVDLSNWPSESAVHFITYKKKADGSINKATQCDWKGIISANTIGSLTLENGSDAGNDVGDFVEMAPTAAWAQDLHDGLTNSLNQDGTVKASAVNTVALSDNAVTSAKIANNAVTPSKIDFNSLILHQDGSGNAVTGITSTVYGYRTGLPSITFTLSNPATVFFFGTTFIQQSGSGTQDNFATLYDGSTKLGLDHTFTSVSSGNGGNIAIIGTASLNAGSHTVQIRTLVSNGTQTCFPARSSLTLMLSNT